MRLVYILSLFLKFPLTFNNHLNQTSDGIELPEEERKTEGHLPAKMASNLFVLWASISFLDSYPHLYLRR